MTYVQVHDCVCTYVCVHTLYGTIIIDYRPTYVCTYVVYVVDIRTYVQHNLCTLNLANFT